MGEEVDVAGGTISGQNQNPYETVIYGEDSKNDIVAIPDENYQVKQILINVNYFNLIGVEYLINIILI